MGILVLSGSRQETMDFVKQQGLPTNVRHIVNKETVPTGLPVSQIFVLPSYYKRRDYHAVEERVKRVIRRCHDVEVLEFVPTPSGGYNQPRLDVEATIVDDKTHTGNATGPQVHFEVEETERTKEEAYFIADADASAEADEFLEFLNGDDD